MIYISVTKCAANKRHKNVQKYLFIHLIVAFVVVATAAAAAVIVNFVKTRSRNGTNQQKKNKKNPTRTSSLLPVIQGASEVEIVKYGIASKRRRYF